MKVGIEFYVTGEL